MCEGCVSLYKIADATTEWESLMHFCWNTTFNFSTAYKENTCKQYNKKYNKAEKRYRSHLDKAKVLANDLAHRAGLGLQSRNHAEH